MLRGQESGSPGEGRLVAIKSQECVGLERHRDGDLQDVERASAELRGVGTRKSPSALAAFSRVPLPAIDPQLECVRGFKNDRRTNENCPGMSVYCRRRAI